LSNSAKHAIFSSEFLYYFVLNSPKSFLLPKSSLKIKSVAFVIIIIVIVIAIIRLVGGLRKEWYLLPYQRPLLKDCTALLRLHPGGPKSRWYEIQVGRNPSGPTFRWAQIKMGQNPGGRKSRWAEIQVGRNSGWPKSEWAEIRVGLTS
jgi:hypothetical protein